MKKRPLVIIAGPTAAGKTAFSIGLAKAINGEIISADSMQVYRHMDIGSAKITKEEMDDVPHHLIDILEPTEDFNIVTFQSLVKNAMEDCIYPANHIPILTGGTGFYIQSVLYDVDFSENEDNSPIRSELEILAESEDGYRRIYEELEAVDPESAKSIHPNNKKRIIRALEFFRQTGERISEHNSKQREKESPYNAVFFVLSLDRQKLYERIDERVDRMIRAGLVEEVQKLKELGCQEGMTSMQGIGYKEIMNYLNGSCTLDEAIYEIKLNSRHFAKRQLTWFRNFKGAGEMIWLDTTEPDLLARALQILKDRGVID